jgi:hypothetical protein
MELKRRSFFRGLGAALGGSAIIHNVPAAAANDVAVTGRVNRPLAEPVHVLEELKARLALMAVEAAQQIEDRIRRSIDGVRVHKSDAIAQAKDVLLVDGETVALTRHMEATFAVPDPERAVADKGLRSLYMLPSCIALSESLISDCKDRRLLAYAKHPMPFDGLGVVAAYGISDLVSLRLLLSYVPTSLQHHFTLDMLYGTV